MINVETKLTGDISAGLDRLAAAAGEATLRAAGFAGAQVFQKEAIARVPVDSGTIRENIIVKRAEESSDTNKKQTYLITVRTGKKNAEGDAFYWRFVEFGTSKMSARPFIRPAFESMKQTALAAMKKRFGQKLSEELAGKE